MITSEPISGYHSEIVNRNKDTSIFILAIVGVCMAFTPEQWRDLGNTVTINLQGEQQSIFFIDRGNGPVLLFLHGFPSSSWDWSWIFEKITTSYRFVTFDFLGFGFSDKPVKHDYSLFEQADIAVQLLTNLGINDIRIVAHDYGDTVAQELLSRYNSGKLTIEIESVFLSNGGIFPERIQFRFIQKLLLSPLGGIVSKFISRKRFIKSFSAIFERVPEDNVLEQYWKIVSEQRGHRIGHRIIRYIDERFENRERWVSALQEYEEPMVFLVGMKDPVSGELMADRFMELISKDVIQLDDIGHYPQVETPEVFYSYLIDFLKTNQND